MCRHMQVIFVIHREHTGLVTLTHTPAYAAYQGHNLQQCASGLCEDRAVYPCALPYMELSICAIPARRNE